MPKQISGDTMRFLEKRKVQKIGKALKRKKESSKSSQENKRGEEKQQEAAKK